RASQIEMLFADGVYALGDFQDIKPFPYLALVPQWHFLNLLAEQAQRYANFTLHMRYEATGLIHDQATGRVVGVRASSPEGMLDVRADLVIGCDGRGSCLRQAAGLVPEDLGAPMDVLWLRLPRHADNLDGSYGVPGKGGLLVLLN